ncbi:formate C-acetyltransferase [Spirochaetia bacterium]|nr:formate C-acetyltransferase [Spirochaetia bacterium]
MDFAIERIKKIAITGRVEKLRQRTLDEERYVSVEQARYITKAYREHPDLSMIMKRAHALREALYHMEIRIDEGELIVGNRTKESCGGVVFPEGGIKWLEWEIDLLETRPQDQFRVRPEDRAYFFDELVPFWEGKTLENKIGDELTGEMKAGEIVGKLNQKDHAQGHICPDLAAWLALGPGGLMEKAKQRLKTCTGEQRDYYEATVMVMEASARFIERYAELAEQLAGASGGPQKEEYKKITAICRRLSAYPAETFHEAIQSLWFLMVLLEMESNASSFSPGRADQFLYPYFKHDFDRGLLSYEAAQELLDLMFIKFNQIVYLRNTDGAEFFAGFPIGFNISLGGQTPDGRDAVNELTYLFLHAQEHVRFRQPNLSARLHKNSPQEYMRRAAEVISLGTGMPQLVNDESIIPAMLAAGYGNDDAINYAVIGCVELSVHGNALGFSDAGMFNMVKVLELTLNNGVDMRTGKQIGPALGTLPDYAGFEELEKAYAKELDYFIGLMEQGLKIVEKHHKEMMPSPILSSVINDCIERGIDVTAGGARYNKSGIQLIQAANLADSMAALKQLVYDERRVDAKVLLEALRNNFPDEGLRQFLLTHAPKYGNDVAWVDDIGEKWVEYIKAGFDRLTNYRGGSYTIGLYTVSAHVPMGKNVGATPDGRRAGEPLADGGLSAVYGRDQKGPTALLKSVSRIKSINAANGTLLNMKFVPSFFHTAGGIEKFVALMRAFVELKIHHVQFNVINKEDLLAAKRRPENYRHLLVRVAGYTANYVDLADVLQNEIIARTEYGA